jgi:hypothetical protein
MSLKGWRTVLVNTIMGLPVFIDALLPVAAAILADPQLPDIIPAAWLPYYTTAVIVVNIWLRAITTTPIGKAGGEE